LNTLRGIGTPINDNGSGTLQRGTQRSSTITPHHSKTLSAGGGIRSQQQQQQQHQQQNQSNNQQKQTGLVDATVTPMNQQRSQRFNNNKSGVFITRTNSSAAYNSTNSLTNLKSTYSKSTRIFEYLRDTAIECLCISLNSYYKLDKECIKAVSTKFASRLYTADILDR
jgi:hypothetical protein